MQKIVLDTNVYISAILFGGNPDKIIHLAKRGDGIEILVSEQIFEEISTVLGRKFGWPNWKIALTLGEIREWTTLIVPRLTISDIKNNVADNKILECAVEGNADYIVSGDTKHLLPLKKYKNIHIVSPAEFVQIFEKQQGN